MYNELQSFSTSELGPKAAEVYYVVTDEVTPCPILGEKYMDRLVIMVCPNLSIDCEFKVCDFTSGISQGDVLAGYLSVYRMKESTLRSQELRSQVILTLQAEEAESWIDRSDIWVTYDSAMSWVSAKDLNDEENEIFLQGHEADEVIDQAEAYYEAAQHCSMQSAISQVMRPYIENCLD